MTRKRFVVTVCALAMAGASTITCAAANAEGFNRSRALTVTKPP